LTFTASGGFTGTVSLSCSGLPTGAACSFSPTSVTVGAGTTSSTLTISTTARAASWLAGSTNGPDHPFAQAALLAALALLIPAVLPRRRKPRRVGIAARLALVLLPALAASGCGGGGNGETPAPPTGGTPAGTYVVTITAASGSTTHSVNYTLTVN
jgi:hypothetical protein